MGSMSDNQHESSRVLDEKRSFCMGATDDPLARMHGRIAFTRCYESYWLKEKGSVPYPRMGGRCLDLYIFFEGLRAFGGMDKVYHRKLFPQIRDLLRLPSSCNNYSTQLRINYERYLENCYNLLEKAVEDAYTHHCVATKSHGWVVPRIAPTLARGKAVDELPVVGCSPSELRERKDYLLQFSEEEKQARASYKQCTEDVRAAHRARVSPFDLETDERDHPLFRDFEHEYPILRLDIRNHIIRVWYRDVKSRLSVFSALEDVPRSFHPLGVATFTYLELSGRINIGVIPIVTPLALYMARNVVPRRRIGIVGAGISGLAAARQLRSFGLSVRLIEASNRFGGRIWTDTKKFEKPVDVGAMLIIGTLQHPMAILAEQVDSQVHIIEDASKHCPLYDIDGKRVPKDDDARASREFNAILDEADLFRRRNSGSRKIDTMSLGETFRMFRDRREQDRWAAQRRVGGNSKNVEANADYDEARFNRLLQWHVANLEYGCAAGIDSLSLANWDQDDSHQLQGDHVLLKSGYRPLIDGMSKGLKRNAKLCSPVRSISVKELPQSVEPRKVPTIEIRFQDGTEPEEFDAVIVTVSLGVLKKETISFKPPLPENKRTAIKKLGWGGLVKVAMKFDRAFWKDEAIWGILRENSSARGEFFTIWNLRPCTGENVLMGLVAEPSADLLEREDDAFIERYAMSILRRQYPSAPDPATTLVTRWSSNSFICGAYSSLSVGSSGDDYTAAAAPVGNIFFSGEHTCREYPTTSAAAFVSGLRAAREVVEALGLVDEIAKFHAHSLDAGLEKAFGYLETKRDENIKLWVSSQNGTLTEVAS